MVFPHGLGHLLGLETHDMEIVASGGPNAQAFPATKENLDQVVAVTFTDDGIAALARIAADVNRSVENIGARRLYTVMERVFEELSFAAPDRAGEAVTVEIEDRYYRLTAVEERREGAWKSIVYRLREQDPTTAIRRPKCSIKELMFSAAAFGSIVDGSSAESIS